MTVNASWSSISGFGPQISRTPGEAHDRVEDREVLGLLRAQRDAFALQNHP